MFDNPIVDVALGLIFIYIVLSLICSAVQEWCAALFSLRSRNLETGIKNLLDGPNAATADYAARVYGHPLIGNLARKGKLPSYIPAQLLSTVLLETVARDHQGKSYAELTAAEVRATIAAIDDANPLKKILATLASQAEAGARHLQDELADWFDDGMARISGWYARTARLWLFGIAVVVTVLTNASTLNMVERIWRDDALRATLSAQAVALSQQAEPGAFAAQLTDLANLPIGWTGQEPWTSGWIMTTLIGWFLTIAAISVGAPFWFDLVGKVAQLRGSGDKPATSQDTRAARKGDGAAA